MSGPNKTDGSDQDASELEDINNQMQASQGDENAVAKELSDEEDKKQQEQEEREAAQKAEMEEETEKNRDASEKTVEHEEVLQKNSGAKASNIGELVKCDPVNLGEELQEIIGQLAKTGVESEKSNSRYAGISGMKKQGAGSVMTGPDGEDSNEHSTSGDDQGASR